MSNKTALNVRKGTNDAIIDPRVERSTRQLGEALVELLRERTFDEITVHDILERAGVGRSTFYAHYRNKTDVLHSSYERMFLAFERRLESGGAARTMVRVLPVHEFSAHVEEQADLLRALKTSGQLEALWELAIGYCAQMIERRIVPLPGATVAMPASLVSRMLAGAYLEMLKWWLERPKRSSPEGLDVTYHEIVKVTLARVGYAVHTPV